jgi:hypothetical protein
MQEHKELIDEYLCDQRTVVIIAPKEKRRLIALASETLRLTADILAAFCLSSTKCSKLKGK